MNLKTFAKAVRRSARENASEDRWRSGNHRGHHSGLFRYHSDPQGHDPAGREKAGAGSGEAGREDHCQDGRPGVCADCAEYGCVCGCVIGAVHVDERRNAALAAACTLSESALKTYQDKVLETIGPEKEQEIRETIALEKMAKYPEPATIQPAKNLVTTDISYDQRVKCWESLDQHLLLDDQGHD